MSIECLCSMDFLPEALRAHTKTIIAQWWQSFDEKNQEKLTLVLERTAGLDQQLVNALIGSEYLRDACSRDPSLLFSWLLADVPFAPLTPVKIIDAINTACADELSLEEFNRRLRKLRRRFMTGIYWRDLNQLADFKETTQAVTSLAQVCIQQALDINFNACVQKYGQPIGKDSALPQTMLVIGLGKLGGGELNVSSDVDLMFVFDEAGQTNHPKKPIDNQTFFNRLAQQLIKSLSEINADGFVFRVDMRLRPYGQSGALCSHLLALENYYQSQGRDWERFAAVKTRVVACTQLPDTALSFRLQKSLTDKFYALIKPFVYRRYIDFSMIDSLRGLKALILQEVNRKGLQDDIKLGAGGIREIEFIAQTFQLIRGGREPQLQTRNLIATINLLGEQAYLTKASAQLLLEHYIFLRKLEHVLQAWQDQQTQSLPNDELALLRVAYFLGFDSIAEFLEYLQRVRDDVSREFQKIIQPVKKELSRQKNTGTWQLLWEKLNTVPDKLLCADALYGEDLQNFHQPLLFATRLGSFKASRHVAILSASARDKLDHLLPLLLTSVTESDAPDRAFECVLHWLDSIVNRPQYLALLLENPQILKHLVELFLASAWVVETLTQVPALLDELLYPENLLLMPDKAQLQSELRQRFLRLDPLDEEAAMETLRHFKLGHNLQSAAAELSGQLSLMQVSDYLSFTAEAILEHVLQLAWQSMTARHGYPQDIMDTSQAHFLIVAYGKLGGLEMAYGSDCDLVFIYDADPQGTTDGKRPLDTQTFYMRLGQRIIHYLNVRTVSGPLYEVDMRLRPSGHSGLLVSSMAAFSRYQRNDAWTWEHQALVRARPVAGDPTLAAQFVQLRKDVLSQARDIDRLKQDVVNMRLKMREHLGSSHQKRSNNDANGDFHLKQDQGGVVDIEFMVQYAVLAWANLDPSLCEWTDNIRILECLQQSGLIPDKHANLLIDHYQTYRKMSHRLTLQRDSSSLVDADAIINERRDVRRLWDYFFKP